MQKSASSPVRVLLVEDERKLRESLAEGLRLEAWSVATAASGADALRQLENGEFNLVVLDWMLPDHDGLEIVRALRARGSSVPILMITARGGAWAEALASSGVTAYLAKPFSFDALVAHARALVGGVAAVAPRT